MGNTKDNETRQRIIDAAMDLFHKKGMDGVNMRELAERAGVNKGLLHYYFKTKASLFKEVFLHQASLLWTDVHAIIESPGKVVDKIPLLVDRYFTLFAEMPSLPAFVLFELQRDPGLLASSALKDMPLHAIALFDKQLGRAPKAPNTGGGVHLLLDVVGLCAFTFGMLPALSQSMKLNKRQREAFLEQRKAHIISMLKKETRA